MSLERIKIFSGNANPNLSSEIIHNLEITQSKAFVGKFSDGESQVEILDNVRGCDVFVIQPTCGPSPASTLMELLIMVDALKRSSAGRITAVVPYLGYSRQDRRSRLTRVPISAKLVAQMIETSGVDRILTSGQKNKAIEGLYLLEKLNNISKKRIVIMPGSGISNTNFKKFNSFNEIHGSFKDGVPIIN